MFFYCHINCSEHKLLLNLKLVSPPANFIKIKADCSNTINVLIMFT